jgi:primosomal replication protein N
VNQFQFTGTILERDTLRYTPAGVPIVTATVAHESQQVEAGVARKVEFEITALGAGEISGRLARAELGAALTFTGFLARKNRNSKALVFHIIDFSAAA